MCRGQGRSFDRSADAASGGYEQWPQQTRGYPSAELAARYAMPIGFGAPAATAMTPPAALPPGVAFTPAPFGMMEPPWAAQARVDASVAEHHAAAMQAQQLAMGMTTQPLVAAPTPMVQTGMYTPAPAGTTAATMNYQQRFGAGATGYQQYGAGGIGAVAATAGAEQLPAAPMWTSQGPNGQAQMMGNTLPAEMTRRIFELGRAAMMREEQEAQGATAPAPAAAAATSTQLMTPQQLTIHAPNAAAPSTGTETGAGTDSTSNDSGAATRRRTESPPKATDAEVEDITPWPTQYLRPLSEMQTLVQSQIKGTGLTDVFAGAVIITPWPGEQWLTVARNCCRGATRMRPARVNSWRDQRLGALVLTKILVSYIMGTEMPATGMSDLEKCEMGSFEHYRGPSTSMSRTMATGRNRASARTATATRTWWHGVWHGSKACCG